MNLSRKKVFVILLILLSLLLLSIYLKATCLNNHEDAVSTRASAIYLWELDNLQSLFTNDSDQLIYTRTISLVKFDMVQEGCLRGSRTLEYRTEREMDEVIRFYTEKLVAAGYREERLNPYYPTFLNGKIALLIAPQQFRNLEGEQAGDIYTVNIFYGDPGYFACYP